VQLLLLQLPVLVNVLQGLMAGALPAGGWETPPRLFVEGVWDGDEMIVRNGWIVLCCDDVRLTPPLDHPDLVKIHLIGRLYRLCLYHLYHLDLLDSL
jgi:hypothetical protein